MGKRATDREALRICFSQNFETYGNDHPDAGMYFTQTLVHMDQITIMAPNPKGRLFLESDNCKGI